MMSGPLFSRCELEYLFLYRSYSPLGTYTYHSAISEFSCGKVLNSSPVVAMASRFHRICESFSDETAPSVELTNKKYLR